MQWKTILDFPRMLVFGWRLRLLNQFSTTDKSYHLTRLSPAPVQGGDGEGPDHVEHWQDPQQQGREKAANSTTEPRDESFVHINILYIFY